MDKKTRVRLEAAASALLQDQLGMVPVNIDAVARTLSLEIVERPDLELNGMPVSGLLIQQDNRRICALNSSDSPRRRRFTLAHEIGHLVLHPPKPQHFDLKARSSQSIGNPREETEANQFAASLLMPEQDIRSRVPPGGFDPFWDDWESEVKKLSDLFNVSQEAMSIRLQSLGLLTELRA